jgi:hypothetical protein
MQDNPLQIQAQPFVKLMHSNLELLTRFATSPEVAAQAATTATSLLHQATESATGLMRSGAFVQLIQGMLNNYTEFLTEFGQTSMSLMSQGQQTLMRQVQEAGTQVSAANEARSHRSRQAA